MLYAAGETMETSGIFCLPAFKLDQQRLLGRKVVMNAFHPQEAAGGPSYLFKNVAKQLGDSPLFHFYDEDLRNGTFAAFLRVMRQAGVAQWQGRQPPNGLAVAALPSIWPSAPAPPLPPDQPSLAALFKKHKVAELRERERLAQGGDAEEEKGAGGAAAGEVEGEGEGGEGPSGAGWRDDRAVGSVERGEGRRATHRSHMHTTMPKQGRSPCCAPSPSPPQRGRGRRCTVSGWRAVRGGRDVRVEG